MGRVCVLMFLGVFSIAAGVGSAQASAVPGQVEMLRTGQRTASPAATHSVRGVVKAISQWKMVIARSSRHSEMTFVLTESTARSASIAVGAEVSVRYWIEGQTLVAAAVFVHLVPHPAERM